MRIMALSLISTILMFSSCNPARRNKVELLVKQDGDSIIVGGVVKPDDSGKVYVDLRKGQIEEMIQKEFRQVITVVFDPGDSLWLSACILPVDTLGNIRISEILMPDSTSDGPFGRDFQYELTQRGTYNLIIGESLMAGEPWEGIFTLKMKIRNNEIKEINKEL